MANNSYEMQMDALTKFQQEQSVNEQRKRDEQKTQAMLSGAQNLQDTFSQRPMTAVELLAKSKPQQGPNVQAFGQASEAIGQQAPSREREMLNRYKQSMGLAGIEQDREKAEWEKEKFAQTGRNQRELIGLKKDETRQRQVETRDYKQKQKDEKTFENAMSKLRGIGRGTRDQIGTLYTRNRLARNALRIVDSAEAGLKGEQGGILPTSQVAHELAMSVATLLGSGGSPAMQTIEHQVPGTVLGDINATKQYILGRPEEFLTQEFVDHFRHLLEAEQKFFANELNAITGSVRKGILPTLQRNPEFEDLFDSEIEAIANQSELEKKYGGNVAEQKGLTGFGGTAQAAPKSTMPKFDEMPDSELDEMLKKYMGE